MGTPARTELFERTREQAALARALDRALAQGGSVIVVEGAAGAGKTALIELAAELAAARRVHVLRARGSEIERDVPLSTLRTLFERHLLGLSASRRSALLAGSAHPLARAIGLAEPGPLAGAQLHRAAQRLVEQLAAGGPLALLVDDLHHADASSLTALAAIARHLDDLPVALIVTRRAEDYGQDPAALEELALVAGTPLTPQPLTCVGVGAVLRARGGPAIDDVVVALGHEATGGNPFLVVQLARAFHETEQPIDRGQVTDLMAGVAQSLSAVLRVRVGRLGADAAVLARAVSVLGDDVSLSEACAVAGLTREATLVAGASLASAGIFASDRVNSFAHPLVRAAVEADLLAAERALIEERAVCVLLDTGADPARAAVHLLRTEPGGDPRAVAALRAAAASASGAAAPRRAVLLLQRALAERPVPIERELLGELISAELRAGDYAAAAKHLRARPQTDCTAAARVADVRRLSRAVMQVEGAAAAAAVLDAGLEEEPGEARLLLEAERLWMSVLEPGSSPHVLDCLERYGELDGDDAAQRAMLAAIAVGLSLGSVTSDIVGSLLERAFGDGALLRDEGADSPLYALGAYAMVASDRLLLADSEMTRALAAARARGSAGGAGMALALRGIARLHLGLIASAEADGLAASRAAAESSGRLRALTVAAGVGVVVDARAQRGDDAGALGILAEYGFAGDLAGDLQLPTLLPRARAHLAAGRAAEALADARRASLARRRHLLLPLDAAPVISLAQATLGQREEAIAGAAAQLERARAWRAPSAIACALRVLGLAHGDVNGIAMLEEAIALLECSPAALERAQCLVALGMLWRRTGQRSLALEALRGGADLAQRLGASALAQRAREHLVVLGARPRRLAFTGADALTASERRAAQLAAAGRTNREIAQELYLSIKTVESHLGRGFRKLGIRSRTELASALSPPSR
jgi:DNA-binding CsgD family transcriptional regulator